MAADPDGAKNGAATQNGNTDTTKISTEDQHSPQVLRLFKI